MTHSCDFPFQGYSSCLRANCIPFSQALAFPINSQTNLCHHFICWHLLIALPYLHYRGLGIEVCTQVMRRQPGADDGAGLMCARGTTEMHQDQFPCQPGGNWQIALPTATVGPLLVCTHPMRPFRKVHIMNTRTYGRILRHIT